MPIPIPLIADIAEILSSHYASHNRINNLFTRCGVTEMANGTLINKITTWLTRANEDPGDPFLLLGCILEEFMERDTQSPDWLQGRGRMNRVLARHNLSYQRGGHILGATVHVATVSLESIIRERNLTALQAEFDRAIAQVESDPPAAITAACAIIESLCKVYIEQMRLTMPQDQSIRPVWRTVQQHLGLGPQSVVRNDMRQILSGLASIVEGVGSLRTHAGSAHGRGEAGVQINASHAQLAIHAASSLVHFVLEIWPRRAPQPTGT